MAEEAAASSPKPDIALPKVLIHQASESDKSESVEIRNEDEGNKTPEQNGIVNGTENHDVHVASSPETGEACNGNNATKQPVTDVVETRKEQTPDEPASTEIVSEENEAQAKESDDKNGVGEHVHSHESDVEQLNEKIRNLNDQINRLEEEKAANAQKVGDLSLKIRRITDDNVDAIKERDQMIRTLTDEKQKMEDVNRTLTDENEKYKANLGQLQQQQRNGSTNTSEPPSQKKSSVCVIL